MSAISDKSFLSFFHHYLPGFVIGLYFVSLQFVQTIDLSFLILLGGLFSLLIIQPALDFRRVIALPTGIAVLLFLSTVLSAAVTGQDFVGRTMPVAHIPGLLVFLIGVLFIREKSQTIPIAWSFFFGLGICVWQFFSVSYAAGFVRSRELVFAAAHPLYLAPNDTLMFAIFFPLIMWCGRHVKGMFGPILTIGYSIFLVGLAELLLSRITLSAIIITFLLSMLLAKRWKVLVGSLFVAGLLIFSVAYYDEALISKLMVLDLDRIKVWIVAWHMFMDAPWLGHGPGSFTALYANYLDRLGSAANYGHDVRHMGWAHSLFFEAAAEKGVLGLGAVIAYFAYLFTTIIKKNQRSGDSFSQAWGLSAILLLLAASVELSLLRVWAIYIIYLMLGLNAVFMPTLDGQLKANI